MYSLLRNIAGKTVKVCGGGESKIKSEFKISFRNGNSGINSVQIIGTILVVTELQVMSKRIQTDEEQNSNWRGIELLGALRNRIWMSVVHSTTGDEWLASGCKDADLKENWCSIDTCLSNRIQTMTRTQLLLCFFWIQISYWARAEVKSLF